MDENEFLLEDRIAKIQAINRQYDLENNAYISFSGGKDSTVLSYLIDMALPNNKIPRVFANTGIEYNDVVRFVKEIALKDSRIIILNQKRNIKKTLEEYGYPFKEKVFANVVNEYQKQYNDIKDFQNMNKEEFKKMIIENPNIEKKLYGKGVFTLYYYYNIRAIRDENKQVIGFKDAFNGYPEKLKYLFSNDNKLKISKECCSKLKKELQKNWQKENKKAIAITGMRKEEGGRRKFLTCLTNNSTMFHPLVVCDNEWVEWFIEKYNIKLCKLYYPPYNFNRTGCKGCPFAKDLQQTLETMAKLLPNEYKQCEILWKPVYDEYRRIGYRLKKYISMELDLFKEEMK